MDSDGGGGGICLAVWHADALFVRKKTTGHNSDWAYNQRYIQIKRNIGYCMRWLVNEY